MASRVNVKFVVALSGGLVLVCAALIAIWYFVLTKSGEEYEALGDRAMAAGNFEEASEFYGRAVGHDRTNVVWLEKWLDAYENLVPETRSEYQSMFNDTYRPLLRQIAQTRRTDVASHRRYLELMHQQLGGGQPTRDAVTLMQSETTAATAFFENDPSADPSWNTLRRYRAIPAARLAASVGSAPEQERAKTEEDLTAVLAVEPGDGEAAVALAGLYAIDLTEARRRNNARLTEEALAKIASVCDGVLAADPEDPWVRTFRLIFDIDEARRAAVPDNVAFEQRMAMAREIMPRFADRTAAVLESLATEAPESVPTTVLSNAFRLEAMVFEGPKFPRFERLLRARYEAAPEDSTTIFTLARHLGDRGDLEEALGLLGKLEAQPVLPVSLDGFQRVFRQEAAPRWAADYMLRYALDNAASADAEVAERARSFIDRARQARDRYARFVPETDAELSLLDGMLHEAEGDLQRAVSAYARYNDAGQPDVRGLWLETRVQRELQNWGEADRRVTALLTLNPLDARALFIKSEIEENKGNNDLAIAAMTQAAAIEPNDPRFAARLQVLRLKAGQAAADDPVTEVILRAQRLAEGSASELPDRAAAEALLRAELETSGYEPRIGAALSAMLMGADRFKDAEAVVAAVLERHPDAEQIARQRAMLAEGDFEGVVRRTILDSEQPDLAKFKQLHQFYGSRGRAEEANEWLDKAIGLDPKDPYVLDFTFVRAVQNKDEAEASRLATLGEELDVDGVGGRTYRARLASMRGEAEKTVEILEEATGVAPVNPVLWRMLGDAKMAAGDRTGSIDALRRAIEIRPDAPETVLRYTLTLAQAQRLDEALTEARRLRPHAEGLPEFMDLYLGLEADRGGTTGRALAIQQRRRILAERPDDIENKRVLAALLIVDRQWAEARTLLDKIREADSSLSAVELEARWFADQGRVLTGEGFQDGLDLARRVFTDYIVENGIERVGADAYLSLARFMIGRGQYTTALRAIEDARPLQTSEKMEADRLLGDLLLTLDRRAEAAAAYTRVVEGGADDAEQNYRKRLIEMLIRTERFEEARAQIAAMGAAAERELTLMLQSADIAAGLGDRAGAIRLADKAVEVHRTNPLSWAKRAQLLSVDPTQLETAVGDLTEALRINPQDWRALQLRASLRFRQERAAEAIEDMRRVVTINPTLDEVLIGLMIELIAAGRDGDALTTASAVIDQRPADSTLILNCSRVFAERALWNRAAVLLQRAWALRESADVGLLYVDALVNSKPANPDEGDRVIQRLVQLGEEVDKSPTLLIASGLLQSARERPQSAAEFMQRAFAAIDAAPTDYLNWVRNLGRVFGDRARREFTQESRESTVAFLDRTAEAYPAGSAKRHWLVFAKAQVLTADGPGFDEGVSAFRSVLDGDAPAELKRLAYQGLGGALYGRKQHAEAEEVWRAGVEAYPDSWEMKNNLAYSLAVHSGRPADALPIAESVAAVVTAGTDARAQALDTLARVQAALGRYDDAEATLDEAEKVVGSTASRVNITLGRARVALGRKACDRARAYLSEAETQLSTLPQIRERFEEDLKALAEQIDSGC